MKSGGLKRPASPETGFRNFQIGAIDQGGNGNRNTTEGSGGAGDYRSCQTFQNLSRKLGRVCANARGAQMPIGENKEKKLSGKQRNHSPGKGDADGRKTVVKKKIPQEAAGPGGVGGQRALLHAR